MKRIYLIVILFLNFLIITSILYSADSSICEKEGTVQLSFKNYNLDVDISSNDTLKNVSIGILCKGFQTANIEDNITTCTYDPKTISCYVATDKLWLVTPDEPVQCNSNFNLMIDISKLFKKVNVVDYSGNVIVSCSNGFYYAQDVSTINLHLNLDKEEFIVNPSYLYWSILSDDNVTTKSLESKSINIYNTFQGFYYTTQNDWVKVEKSNNDNETTFVSSLFITPDISMVNPNSSGIYQSSITIHDKLRNIEKVVPIFVQIRKYDEPIIVPLENFENNNSFSYKISDAEKFYLEILTKDFFTSLKNIPNFNSMKTYIVVYLPDILPDVYFAYVPWKKEVFVPIEKNNIIEPDADNLYYGQGFIDNIKIGPYMLRGLKGRIKILVKVGEDYSNAKEIEDINFVVNKIEGNWKLIDEFQGITYEHPETFYIYSKNGEIKGCFMENNQCKYPVKINYGDGFNELYNIKFNINNYTFIYSIKKLTENSFYGTWYWCDGKNCYEKENFYGYKIYNF